jgi:signal transduction histidine kinase
MEDAARQEPRRRPADAAARPSGAPSEAAERTAAAEPSEAAEPGRGAEPTPAAAPTGATAGRRSWEPPWAADEPGRRDFAGRPRRGPHGNWPGGAVLLAILFHVLGARSAAGDGSVYRPMDLLSYALLLIGPLALFWRRRYPITVLAVAGAASIGFATFAEPHWMFVVAPVIALFTAARAGRRRDALLVAAVGYAAYLLITWVFAADLGVPVGARPGLRIALLLAAGLGLAIVLGGAAKVRGEHMAEMMKVRAERARAKEEQERRQASEERLRIARELHDVLGHHLSLINVQAGVGLHLMDNRPEQAREALTAIKTASAEALREVRAVLGVLRPEEEAAPRQPALGLDRLGELTADAGLPVTTSTTGERRTLPAEVDRAAYRIVQEALTNVRKHAAAGSATEVAIEYAPDAVRLAIRNAGPPGQPTGAGRLASTLFGAAHQPPASADPPAGGGSGIAGMRARAETLGGALDAGPSPDGGFLVAATLPTPIPGPAVGRTPAPDAGRAGGAGHAAEAPLVPEAGFAPTAGPGPDAEARPVRAAGPVSEPNTAADQGSVPAEEHR